MDDSDPPRPVDFRVVLHKSRTVVELLLANRTRHVLVLLKSQTYQPTVASANTIICPATLPYMFSPANSQNLETLLDHLTGARTCNVLLVDQHADLDL